jgi:hypothetical protein
VKSKELTVQYRSTSRPSAVYDVIGFQDSQDSVVTNQNRSTFRAFGTFQMTKSAKPSIGWPQLRTHSRLFIADTQSYRLSFVLVPQHTASFVSHPSS